MPINQCLTSGREAAQDVNAAVKILQRGVKTLQQVY